MRIDNLVRRHFVSPELLQAAKTCFTLACQKQSSGEMTEIAKYFKPLIYKEKTLSTYVCAAITLGLCRRVLGADDAPFRPVMGKRGEAGAAAGTATTVAGSSSSEPTTVAASASETPSRW